MHGERSKQEKHKVSIEQDTERYNVQEAKAVYCHEHVKQFNSQECCSRRQMRTLSTGEVPSSCQTAAPLWVYCWNVDSCLLAARTAKPKRALHPQHLTFEQHATEQQTITVLQSQCSPHVSAHGPCACATIL